MSRDTAALGDFFEAGRAYTTQDGYLAPESAFEFACAAVIHTPAIEEGKIAFGFLRDSRLPWTPTGFLPGHFRTFRGRGWQPTAAPEWLAAAVAAATDRSPLAQAEDAKRARDLVGEVGILMAAGSALESAPWYPARPGDLVHVHYERAGEQPAFGETYLIGDAGNDLLSMQLLTHNLPATVEYADDMTGCFATAETLHPVDEMWFEAGPHRLTIVRDGLVVHAGASGHLSGAAAAGVQVAARDLAQAGREAQRYLERGEPELALARLRSYKALPPCGTPGPMPDHADCARPRGHRGAHSDDAGYTEPPHQCPALPEELHAVVTVGAHVTEVHFAGLHEDAEAAADHAAGFVGWRTAAHPDQDALAAAYVRPAPGLPGEMVLDLPGRGQLAARGTQLAVVVPLRVLPDLRAEDERAAEGMASALTAEDYADDFRDVDE
ncbi:hypothetical protein ACWD64_20040 [Streptomyces antibioticus]